MTMIVKVLNYSPTVGTPIANCYPSVRLFGVHSWGEIL